MAGPPSYPDTGSTSEDTGPPPGGGRSRLRTGVITVLVIAALAALVILHLTGVLGAGTHG